MTKNSGLLADVARDYPDYLRDESRMAGRADFDEPIALWRSSAWLLSEKGCEKRAISQRASETGSKVWGRRGVG